MGARSSKVKVVNHNDNNCDYYGIIIPKVKNTKNSIDGLNNFVKYNEEIIKYKNHGSQEKKVKPYIVN